MQKWEYSYVSWRQLFSDLGYQGTPDRLWYTQALNLMGDQGWELVLWESSTVGVVVFRRPKPE